MERIDGKEKEKKMSKEHCDRYLRHTFEKNRRAFSLSCSFHIEITKVVIITCVLARVGS